MADLNAMGASLQLVIGGWGQLYAALFAAGSVYLEIKLPYSRYAKYLKWLCLALFAYVATAFVVKIDWPKALKGTFVPHLAWNSESLTMLIAILGTTISPYLFFWQASGEVEELEAKDNDAPLKKAPQQAKRQMDRIHWDTTLGMAFSNVIAWFIMLTVAMTLHQQGKTEIQTAAQAAESLRPVAGPLAFYLFAAGIIGTGLLALPVLAGSAAYAVGEARRWPVGLERNARQAKGFYGVIAAATLLAVVLNFTRIEPMQALFWSAVINGVVATPVMVTMMLMTSNPKVMGKVPLPLWLRISGWLSTALMAAATVGFFATMKG
jgi:Mn2+/Fe2+ NRAMP family transporter